MLILKASSLLEKWVIDELNNNMALAYSETGYSNDDINLAWLRHFDKATYIKVRGQFRLLLLDGFSSHVEYDFVEYAI
jgi:DDE superfamily endonuclease